MGTSFTRLLSTVTLLAALLVLVGCGGPRMRDVKGSVTFDGEPVPDGNITFVPEDPKIGPTQGTIKAGRYEAKANEGKNKVQVTASKIRPGGAKGAGGEPVPEGYIPAEYNVKTTLSADVKAGSDTFDFALKSKGKK